MRKLNIIVISLLFILTAILAAFNINDPDVPQYLASGKYILDHKTFPHVNVFAYPNQNFPMPWNEWLFQVITYLIYASFSWFGLVLFQILAILTVFFILFKIYQQKKYHPLSFAVFFFLAILISTERFMLAAEHAGLIFIILYIYLLNDYLIRPSKKILWLPFLQILWTNAHGSFPLGLLLIGAYLTAPLLKNAFQKYFLAGKNTILWTRGTRHIAFILFFCVLASFLTPYGLEGFIWPFKVMFFGESRVIAQNILAFGKTLDQDTAQLSISAYKFLLFFSALILLLNITKIRLLHLFLLAPFFYLSLQSIRNIAMFSLISAAILPGYLDNLWLKFQNWGSRLFPFNKKRIFEQNKRYFPYLISIFIIIYIFWLIWSAISGQLYLKDQRSRRFGFGLTEIVYPEKAVNFVIENQLQGNVFNDYGTGSYLNWRSLTINESLPNRLSSFIDGRDSYPLAFFRYYHDVLNGIISFNEVAEKYSINYALINHIFPDTKAITTQLYHHPDWILVYFDEISVIFASNNEQNKEIIEKYAVDFQKNKNFDPENLKSIKKRVNFFSGRSFRGEFFANIGLLDQAILEFQKAIEAYNENPIPYANLGVVYQQSGRFDEALKAYNQAIKINKNYAPVHFNLATLYQRQNNIEQAIKEYQKTIQIKPKYPLARYNLANLYLEQGRIDEAKKEFKAELKINPAYQPAQESLNQLQTQQNNPQQKTENIEELLNLIEKTPNNAELYLRLGVVYGSQGQENLAIEQFKKAIELDPELALAHFNLANAYIKKQMTDLALEEYEKTVALDPDLSLVYLNLGIIYRYQKRDLTKAIEYWQKYLELEPNDPQKANIQAEIQQMVLEEIRK